MALPCSLSATARASAAVVLANVFARPIAPYDRLVATTLPTSGTARVALVPEARTRTPSLHGRVLAMFTRL